MKNRKHYDWKFHSERKGNYRFIYTDSSELLLLEVQAETLQEAGDLAKKGYGRVWRL